MIHPLAYIDPTAKLGANVTVQPFAYVGPGVTIGDNSFLHHHACVEGNTVLGESCEVFPHANIGTKTQDLKHKGGNPGLRIGNKNVFREYVCVHAGTADGTFTTIGDNNLFLNSSHVAHDCVIANNVILSAGVLLAGHVSIEDYAIIGGASAAHQFVRIGAHAMIGGLSAVIKDVPPFMIGNGNPLEVRGYNKIGLERRGFTPEQLLNIRRIYKILYAEKLNLTQALDRLKTTPDLQSPELTQVLTFIEKSERGIIF